MRWISPPLALLAAAALAFGLGIALGVIAWPTAAVAAPLIEIKARTELTLGAIRAHGDGEATITGHLLDKLTSEPLAGQVVTVALGGRTVDAVTRADGTFEATVEISPGPQPLVVSYRGASALDPAELKTEADPGRAAVTLTLAIEGGTGGARITARAMVDDQPVALPVRLALGPPGGDPTVDLGEHPAGTPFALTRAAAGGPGAHRLRATFRGDPQRQPATVDGTVELAATTMTTLDLADARVAFEDDVVARGRVTDEDGHPVGRAAVTLTSGDRRLAQGATDDLGRYELRVEAERVRAGDYVVQVAAEPSATYLRASHSLPHPLTVAAPQPVPVSYTLLAFAATVTAAGGFFLGRAKPWRRLVRPAIAVEAPVVPHDRPLTGAVTLARPRLISTLRRAADDGISGNVRDVVRGRPIAAATITLRLGDAHHDLVTDDDGSFTIEGLGAGQWAVEVLAEGHVRERFGASMPHRGELRGLKVDLVPVRERVFQLYRRAAEPALPEPRLWGVWSPRQIIDHVRGKHHSPATPALATLTGLVEEVYFSARLANEEILPIAAARVDEAVVERAGRRP